MPLQIIPTSSDPFYKQTTVLDGVPYVLAFAYNQRETCWYLTILDAQETELVKGLKVVSNWPLLRRQSDTRLPPGEIMAKSYTTDDSPPGLNDFGPGKRVELFYVTVDLLTRGTR